MCFALALSGPATAQVAGANTPDNVSHPDLYVHIRVAGFSSPVELRQSGARTRLDLSAGGVLQTYIADRDKGVLISLTATGQSRIALVFPLDHNEGIVPLPLDLSVMARQGTLKVVGASMVAGRSCRLIEFTGYLGQAGIVCASMDNIILQMTRKGRNQPLFQVTDIVVARQDPKWFRAPPDYQLSVLPAIGGASTSGDASQTLDNNTGLLTAQPPAIALPQPKPQMRGVKH